MLPDELIRKVRMIEITSRKRVDDVMSGNYKSQFKGQGMQFAEHRLYVPGDDVRHIDWKVSARSRDPLIKKYEEERELAVFLIVDVSGSNSFGSDRKLKSEAAAEIAGMLTWAALNSGDRVGLLLFAGGVEKVIPPRKGKQQVARMIREIIGHRAQSRGTRLDLALDAAGRVMKHSGVVFVISDFIAEDYGTAMRRLARRHDVIAISVADLREAEVPDVGRILVADPETGGESWVDTGSYAFKQWLQSQRKKRADERDEAFRGGEVDLLEVHTREDYADAVVKFFRRRRSRR